MSCPLSLLPAVAACRCRVSALVSGLRRVFKTLFKFLYTTIQLLTILDLDDKLSDFKPKP